VILPKRCRINLRAEIQVSAAALSKTFSCLSQALSGYGTDGEIASEVWL